jgi:hypothetical protein
MPMRTEIFWAAVVNFELPVQMCKNLRDGLPDSGEVFDGSAEPDQGGSKSISRKMPAKPIIVKRQVEQGLGGSSRSAPIPDASITKAPYSQCCPLFSEREQKLSTESVRRSVLDS